MKNNLIFDLGFFDGSDTKNYLSKGFKVIAVEANPKLYEIGKDEFRDEIESGKLILLNNAFSDTDSREIQFFINTDHLDWSTCDYNKTKFWNIDPVGCVVKTISLHKLFYDYGIPYYIKTDIEGLDSLVLTQLENCEKPEYLSFELSRFDYFKIFSYLYINKYSQFQLINQSHNAEYSSGEFGEFLTDKWLTFDECLTRYMKYKELKAIDNVNLALGWVDIHARK